MARWVKPAPPPLVSGGGAFLLALSVAFAGGCSGLPRVVEGPKDIPDGSALVAFSAVVVGDQLPVHVAADGNPLLEGSLLGGAVVVYPVDEGAPTLGDLVVVAVSPEPTRVRVTRVGDFWEFAGGRLERDLVPSPGTIAYLGTISIEIGEAQSLDAVLYEEELTVVGALPRSPAEVSPRKRYLVSEMRIIDDVASARALLRERFGVQGEEVVDCSAGWERVRSGGLLGSSTARPVPVVAP